MLSGNKQVATAVGSGQIAFGLTDTDDAMGEVDAGSPVAIVYPDREPDELGTLFIPNTLAIIKGSPHRPEARGPGRLPAEPGDRGRAGQRPERADPAPESTEVSARVETPKTVHAMAVDFEAAVKVWDGPRRSSLAVFGGD